MAERTLAVDNEVRLPSSTSASRAKSTSTTTRRSAAAAPAPAPAPAPATAPTTAATAAAPPPVAGAGTSANTSTCSQRITRSSARQAASEAGDASPPAAAAAAAAAAATTGGARADPASRLANSSVQPLVNTSSRKRKSTGEVSPSSLSQPGPSGRRSKRQKIGEAAESRVEIAPLSLSRPNRKDKGPAAMETPDRSSGPAKTTGSNPQSSSSSRKSSRSKKAARSPPVPTSRSTSSSARRSKRQPDPGFEDDISIMPPGRNDPAAHNSDDDQDSDEEEDNENSSSQRFDEDGDDNEEDDPFRGFPGVNDGLGGTLRALTSMMGGFSSRLRSLLNNLRDEDPSVQLVAVQELSEILLVSNEETLSGHFSPDAFIKELVNLMNMEDHPEIMLIACRCLANLMEALPASVANVVYGNAVPVLCSKLLEIAFIDLAEQALSTLEKISVEYPSSIVREGGLTACLSFLDFFATSTQRTAVTTAANCCRNIAEEHFPVVKDVMPILLNVLGSNDQRVVEQASICVSGIVESFKYQPSKLEELVSVDLLVTILRLLLPGSTNLIGPSIRTQFLRVLVFSARASPRLSAELFKLNVVETLYQVLTGVSPPAGTEDIASKLDSVIVMQALIHRPREQILEALNVICEMLPGLPRHVDPGYGDFVELRAVTTSSGSTATDGRNTRSSNDKRLELLYDCRDDVRRFALIIFPTLTDAFSSTVNLSVRQKVLTAQLKMLSNLDEDILLEALTPVPYASLLASILSQQDHPSLVILGLQASELLLNRLDRVYRYLFYREGVVHEISKIASTDDSPPEGHRNEDTEANPSIVDLMALDDNETQLHRPMDEEDDGDQHDDDDDDDEDNDNAEEEDDEDEDDEEDEVADQHQGNNRTQPADETSPASSRGSTMSVDISDMPPLRRLPEARPMRLRIRDVAKRFLQTHDHEGHGETVKAQADQILNSLSRLAEELKAFYSNQGATLSSPEKGRELFTKLASYFDGDILESVTSAELLGSSLVQVLLNIFSNPDAKVARDAQCTFLEVFMGYAVKSKPKTATAESPATPFSVMVHKLQNLLSRSEHFEVLTVHQNALDHNRSNPISMLGKQIRLRLVADDDSGVPPAYRNILVSIHAISTFKALDDYLRSRINLVENRSPRAARRDGLSRALAAMAGATGMPINNAAAVRMAERSLFGGSSMQPPPPPPPPPAPPAASTPSSSRSARKSRNRSLPIPEPPETPRQPGEPTRDKAPVRHPSRRKAGLTDSALPPQAPPEDPESAEETLECADEKQLSDDDEMGENPALDAIVGGLEEEMTEDSAAPDPSAINMEIATGGNITARKEDGTRVPTPSSSNVGKAGLPLPGQSTPTPSGSSSRPSTYASALRAIPQDWHIEYSVDGKAITNDMTIYRAVHSSAFQKEGALTRSFWSATHTIKFRKTQGPAPAERPSTSHSSEAEGEADNALPSSLAKHPATARILRLLQILHDLNANIEDVLSENRSNFAGLHVEPLSQFVNTKLTAKLNRQLEEPLIVASNCLPNWAEDLARMYSFLFPFETRHLFLQSTSFGYARSMARWGGQIAEEVARRDRGGVGGMLGRLQRQKVRISRQKILESALKVMDLYGSSQSVLEVEYFEEVGTGLGPTLEFYSTVSREFCRKKLRLWRDMESTAPDDFVSAQNGLFPRPLSKDEATNSNGERILHLFKMLGKFVARSMIDSRMIDINFNPIFFRIGDTTFTGVKPSLGAVKIVDPGLARSLNTIKRFALAKQEIEQDPARRPTQKARDTDNIEIDGVRLDDLCLDFTLPGYPSIELEENGSSRRVTIENVESYLESVIDMTLGSGVRRQVDAFRAGFSQVFPYSALHAFTPGELVNLFGLVEEDWSLETLLDSVKADHGFNMDSPSVRNLLQVMSEYDMSQRRDFLQFTTGSPKLPIGGFKSLTPMFTVVCKPSEPPYSSDDYLPSVMTCANYLKLPNYSSLERMRKQLTTAINEGQGAFLLS